MRPSSSRDTIEVQGEPCHVELVIKAGVRRFQCQKLHFHFEQKVVRCHELAHNEQIEALGLPEVEFASLNSNLL